MFTRQGNILLEDLNEMRIGVTDGLVAWYPGWDDMNDRSIGPVNHGVATGAGATIVTGIKPNVKAFSTDGTDTIDMNQVITGGDFSASLYVKSSTSQVVYATMLSQGHDRLNWDGFAFMHNNFWAGTATGGVELDFPFVHGDDIWHYLAVTYSGTTLNAYMDNTLVDTAECVIDFGTYGVKIGGDSITPTKNYNGLTQDIRFYNRAITPTEIATNYILMNPNEDNRAFISKLKTLYLAGDYTETDIIS
jgi:hypothetical protein